MCAVCDGIRIVTGKNMPNRSREYQNCESDTGKNRKAEMQSFFEFTFPEQTDDKEQRDKEYIYVCIILGQEAECVQYHDSDDISDTEIMQKQKMLSLK